MNFCSIVSQASKPNIKTVLNTICLFFVFFVSANTVGAVSSPDLIVQTIAADKTTLETGESFEIQARLWNRGTAVSGATTLRYYLSTDDTISLSDTEVDSDRVHALSSRGASAVRRRSDLSQTLTAPDTPGVHYYGVCIDAVPDESDTTNNCSEAIAITVEAPPPAPAMSADPMLIPRPEDPDLLISADRVDRSTIKQGWGVRLHITLENRGMRAAPATTIRFYRSTDATISPEADTELRAVPVGGLGPGKSYTTWALLPSPFAVGMYYYGACLDAVESEFDTTNNCSDTIEITVERHGTGTPTLIPVGTIRGYALGVRILPVVLDVSGYFLGKVERYTANSSETSVVTVSMSGTEVALTAVGEGYATVTILASSGDLAAKQTFSVSVGGTATPEHILPDPDLSPEVSIQDANLRAAVRSTLGLAEGVPITQQKMQGLIRLSAYQRGIADLSGLEHATNLTFLTLSNNTISDISAVSGLTNLTHLDLLTNSVSNISAVSGLTNLIQLDLRNNSISDISAVSRLTNLRSLSLNYNTISDISALSGLTNLTSLALSNTGISDISVLSGLTNLTRLSLGENSISDISVLSGLTNLTTLDLRDNSISDISALSGLTNLIRLWLYDTGISDISVLSGLTNLTSLALSNTGISDISVLSGLTNLTRLDLRDNSISDISALSGLINLTSLLLYYNSISDISVLSGLTNLRTLGLNNNLISDISALSGLTNLTNLGLYYNSISDVTPLENLTSLTHLVLSGNPIEDLAPLRRLKENNPNVSIDIDINADLNNAPLAPPAPLIPAETALLSNYPNPFNPETWIPYQLAKSADVTLTIYDIRGVIVRRLALGHRPAGFYRSRGRAAHWDGRNQIGEKVATGLYFYTLTAGDFNATGKMLIQK